MKASKGDVRAITELANRLEGKPLQAIEIDENASATLAERIEAARKRVGDSAKPETIPAGMQGQHTDVIVGN